MLGLAVPEPRAIEATLGYVVWRLEGEEGRQLQKGRTTVSTLPLVQVIEDAEPYPAKKDRGAIEPLGWTRSNIRIRSTQRRPERCQS